MKIKLLVIILAGAFVVASSYYGWQAKRTTKGALVLDQKHQYLVRTTATNSSDEDRSVTAKPEPEIKSDLVQSGTAESSLAELPIEQRSEKPIDHTRYKAQHALPEIQPVTMPSSVTMANSLTLTQIKALDVEDLSPPTMMKGDASGEISSVGGAYSTDSAYEAPLKVIDSVSRQSGIPAADLQQAFD